MAPVQFTILPRFGGPGGLQRLSLHVYGAIIDLPCKEAKNENFATAIEFAATPESHDLAALSELEGGGLEAHAIDGRAINALAQNASGRAPSA